MEPKIKIFEGLNLDKLMEDIKNEFGDEYKILYQDKIKIKTKVPFIKKTKYIIIVEPKINETKFEDILGDEMEKNIEKEEFTYSPYSYQKDKQETKEDKTLLKKEEDKPIIKEKRTIMYTEEQLYPSELTNEFTGKALDLIDILRKKEVEIDIAKEVVKFGCGLEIDTNKLDLKHFTYRESLIEGIEKTIDFAGDIFERENTKIVAFLGPTGVGKTTSLFKIASKLILEQKKKVAVISIDTFKAGAGDQARSYCNILGIPFYILSDPKKIRETVDDLGFVDHILIDTVGRSHYDHWKLGEIKEILRFIDEIKYLMVVSCNWNTKETYKLIEKYQKFFKINYLFFTKIDETSYPGLIVNLAYKTKIPLSYISTGQNVPEDIKILTPERLTSYLLMELE